MKILRLRVISAQACGGILDGLEFNFERSSLQEHRFRPMCFIGPNGSGKSQLFQVLAEVFQAIFHAIVPSEERGEYDFNTEFEIEYLIWQHETQEYTHVCVERKKEGRSKLELKIRQLGSDREWLTHSIESSEAKCLIPMRVVGYSSGENQTLSLPFTLSRSHYATRVYESAIGKKAADGQVADTRLLLIDYGAHLESLVANLLIASSSVRAYILDDPALDSLHSFRCVVQLAHPRAPKFKSSKRGLGNTNPARKGIQLTPELERYIDQLKKCSTCFRYEDREERYTFDFFVNSQTRQAFRHFWRSSYDLYGALRQISMLSDLVLPRDARIFFREHGKSRPKFATSSPEPVETEKVFRFEEVRFVSSNSEKLVNYASLSDGEHQLLLFLSTMSMLSGANTLFLLDEPESHFNPEWRVHFVTKLMDLPTEDGQRSAPTSAAGRQECFLTTHAPFVPCDLPREQVLIVRKEGGKVRVKRPEAETFGATFDTILDECFGIRPPMSQGPRNLIKELMDSEDPETVKAGLRELGDSVERVFLLDHLRQLSRNESS